MDIKVEEPIVEKFDCYASIPKDFTGCCIDTSTGITYWMKNGKFHNETGPVIKWPSGVCEWAVGKKSIHSETEFHKIIVNLKLKKIEEQEV